MSVDHKFLSGYTVNVAKTGLWSLVRRPSGLFSYSSVLPMTLEMGVPHAAGTKMPSQWYAGIGFLE